MKDAMLPKTAIFVPGCRLVDVESAVNEAREPQSKAPFPGAHEALR